MYFKLDAALQLLVSKDMDKQRRSGVSADDKLQSIDTK